MKNRVVVFKEELGKYRERVVGYIDGECYLWEETEPLSGTVWEMDEDTLEFCDEFTIYDVPEIGVLMVKDAQWWWESEEEPAVAL